jgi:hypothetical protein
MRFRPLTAVLAAVLLAPPLAAQSLWLVPDGRRVLFAEILHPDFDGPGDDLLTTAWFFTGRIGLAERVTLHVEVPVAHVEVEGSFLSDGSESVIGNPYVGGLFRFPGFAGWAEVGVRLPIGGANPASLVGLIADIDRLDAWVDEVLPVKALLGRRWTYSSGAFAEVRGGPLLLLDIGEGDRTDGFLNASVLTGLDRPGFLVALGVSGTGALTGGGNFEERTLFQGGGLVEIRVGRFRPGVSLVLPIDSQLRNSIDLVLGVRLGVVLP